MSVPEEVANWEVQLLYQVVERATQLLPQIPQDWRHTTNSLFQAYNEIVEELDIEPSSEAKITKLLFKIGGSSDGDAIIDKFQAVMAKMNITVQFDTDDSFQEEEDTSRDQSSISHDEFSLNDAALSNEAVAVQFDTDGSFQEEESTSREEISIFHDESPLDDAAPFNEAVAVQFDTDDSSQKEEDTSHEESSVSHDDSSLDDAAPSNEAAKRVLQRNASAFECHRDKIHAIQDVEAWQDKASILEHRAELYAEAREEDRKAERHDVLGAWHEIAAEVDETPLDELPPNVYSKRVEKIATRTHEIKTTKNALAGWRHRAREHIQKHKERWSSDKSENDDIVSQNEARLSRLAQKTYENLSKSRVVARWANRAVDTKQKAVVAEKAQEMNLKAKVFGLLAKRRSLSTTDNLSIQDETGSNLSDMPRPAHLSKQAEAGPSSREPDNEDELDEATKLATGSNLRDMPRPAHLSKQAEAGPSSREPDNEDELDEATQLARRHMLRWKMFNAWEDYTEEHKTKVEGFATQKVIDPWRTKASQFVTKAVDHAQDQKNCQEREVLTLWHNDDRQEELETMASNFERKTRLGGSLGAWKGFTKTAEAREQQHSRMAGLADTYRASVGALQDWKARSRETAVHTGMGREALETWREKADDEKAHEENLENMAHRVGLWHIKSNTFPPWRAAALESIKREATLQCYGERADYYSHTTGAIDGWRNAAKDKRKAALRDAYSEARSRVKKAMGARAISQWHERSVALSEDSNSANEEVQQSRGSNILTGAFDDWRERARQKIASVGEAIVQANETRKANALEEWFQFLDEREEWWDEQEENRYLQAKSQALKGWKLGSLRLESFRDVGNRLLSSKERRIRKDPMERWRRQAMYLSLSAAHAAQRDDDDVPAVTPERPRLFQLAEPTTTPLAPVPGGIVRRGNVPRKSQLKVSWANLEE